MFKELIQNIIPQLRKLQNEGNHESVKDFIEATASLIFVPLYWDKIKECEQKTSYDEIKELLKQRSNQTEEIPITIDDVWFFGYGSIIWKVDFPFIDRRRGFITGYQRNFYQHSIDHRGTPSKPGRVVTIVPTQKSEDRVYGMAYRIAARHKDEVLKHLDFREKNGYERCKLRFYEFPETSGNSFDVTMYIATADNDSYAGHVHEISAIADQIFTSSGPSGPNREYLFHLAKAMRVLFPGVEDSHLYELEEAVRKLVKNVEPKILEHVLLQEIKNIFQNILKMIMEDTHENDMNCVNEAAKQLNSLKECCTKTGWKEAILTREYLKHEGLKNGN